MAKYNETDNNTINLISNGTDITGDVKSNGDIRIDGTLRGNLKTKGKVVIGPTGKVQKTDPATTYGQAGARSRLARKGPLFRCLVPESRPTV